MTQISHINQFIHASKGWPKIWPNWELTGFFLRCGYCDVDYEFIGKLESFEEDWTYINDEKSLNSLQNPFFLHSNKKKKLNSTALYFSYLDKKVIQKLTDLYRVDFEMFGYSPQDFIY